MNVLTIEQATYIENLFTRRLANYIKKCKIKNLVLGESGGLDSAKMTITCLKAIELLKRENYYCGYKFVFIDVESDPNDLVKALELAERYNFKLDVVNLTELYHKMNSTFRKLEQETLPKIRVANGNLKCRLRLLYLFDLAQLYGGIVMDTDDLSELLMGFFTKHGDVGDVKLQQFLTKAEIYDLAEYFGMCQSILDSAPGDGLGVTKTNRAIDQLGMDYLKIDYSMSRLVGKGFNYNGSIDQLDSDFFKTLISVIAVEIGELEEKVVHVVKQSLWTAFKRVGDDAVNLVKSRKAMKLPELGSSEFNRIYLQAIKASSK